MARQSTVARLSRSALIALIAFCDTHNCGVILRQHGFEYGYTADELVELLAAVDAKATKVSRLCIRRGWDSSDLLQPAPFTQRPLNVRLWNWRARRYAAEQAAKVDPTQWVTLIEMTA